MADELRAEYDFDYVKAKPNRFVAQQREALWPEEERPPHPVAAQPTSPQRGEVEDRLPYPP